MASKVPVSRFAQSYREHLRKAAVSDDVIHLEQRSGDPGWVLQSERRHQATSTATTFLAAALGQASHDDEGAARVLSQGIASAAPWVRFLPEADRREFVDEALQTLRACASIDSFAAFGQMLEDWRSTAEIHADAELAAMVSTPIVEPLDLPVE